MAHRSLSWFLFLVGVFYAPHVFADEVTGLRSAELAEVSHKVRVTMHPGFAELVVERTVFNPGPKHDQATFDLDLPDGAVAVGLRTLGLKDGKPHWYDGELLEAEEAARRYQELTGIGGYYPKDPALLSWRSMDVLKLQVFPCPPRERKSIEYTLLIPTEYREGAHHLELEGLGTQVLAPDLSLAKLKPGARVESADQIFTSGAHLPLSAERSISLRYVEPLKDIRLELARANAGEGRDVQHISVELGVLSTVPEKLDVILIVDRSHSMVDGATEAARRAAQAYLKHAPEARMQVISFDRQARAEFPTFLSAGAADQQLSALSWTASNGSNIEAALSEAAQQFNKSSQGRERRVIVFTDAYTSSRVNPARLLGLSKGTGALVHIGIARNLGMPSLNYEPMDGWSRVAELTGGLVWKTRLPSPDSPTKEIEKVFEEWVRPVRVHEVRIGLNAEVPLATLDSMSEGEGWTDLQIAEESRKNLYFRGKLWATPLARGASADKASSDRWAGLVFGSSVHSELTEDEMFVVAKRAHAVSPVTSLLAIEPGVRPSTEGIDWTAGRGAGFGAAGLRMGSSMMGAGASSFNHAAYIEELVEKHWTACGGHGPVRANIETTFDEIVDITSVLATKFKDVVAEACLSEALWNERLPQDFRQSFDSYRVAANYL